MDRFAAGLEGIGKNLDFTDVQKKAQCYNRSLVSGIGAEYKYNVDGLRVSKKNSKKSTEYYIIDGTYIGEVTEIGNKKYVITQMRSIIE